MKLVALSFALVFLLAGLVQARPVQLFVSPKGDDGNPGTEQKPFCTLQAARQTLLKLKHEGKLTNGAQVFIREGTYFMAEPLVLTEADSGTPTGRIYWEGYRGETPILTGGKSVDNFKPLKDEPLLARLSPEARGHVLVADLRELGLTDYGQLKRRGFCCGIRPAGLELFWRNQPMTLARWPNKGEYTRIADVPAGQHGGKFTYSGERPARWKDVSDLWVHGYWTYDWADSYEKVARLDLSKHEVTTVPPHGCYGYRKGQRFYFLNVFEELDSPGEYYLDRATGKLYFWPPEPLKPGDCFVSMATGPLLKIDNADYITVRGLVFEGTRGSGLEVKGDHDLIAGCIIRDLGTYAINVSGHDTGVAGCEIYGTGGGGIRLSGGDRRTLSAGRNFVVDCTIHDSNRWSYTYRPAVLINGVGSRIAHNVIYDLPHCAILLGGNDHVIEYNEIYKVALDTGDVGAFYMGRDLTQRGNVVRYNFFHELGKGNVNAVYLDDCTSGTLVYGNIIQGVLRAVMVGGGRDNIIDNNIMVDCPIGIHFDARGLGWMKHSFDVPDGVIIKRLHAVHFDQPPYITRYPKLRSILTGNPAEPVGNVFTHNIYSYPEGKGRFIHFLDGLNEQSAEIHDNFVDGDPGFVDAAHLDFRLKDDSPVFKLGFKPLPYDEIGLLKQKTWRKFLPPGR